ncbi:MAG: hypothetical protein KKA05_10720, partial [Alphaproteobacteria bacterium]|nr:hypothetical protein [Alphaproteobacteria bacterium]
MNSTSENNETNIPTTPVDRGIPSVAAMPKSKAIIMAIFILLALTAIAFVIVDGMAKSAPASLVEPEEVTFKGPSAASVPYIEPAAGVESDAVQPALASAAISEPQATEMERLMQAEALRMAKEQQVRRDERLRSPQLIIDKNAPASRSVAHYDASVSAEGPALAASGVSARQNEWPGAAYDNPDVETARATQIKNLSSLIAQGTMVPGILETALQSDLPGMVRAIVSENVYGHDGSHILIPKGARLIGRYRSGLVRGQTRVFVIWNRVLRQDGVSINISSMGTDDL